MALQVYQTSASAARELAIREPDNEEAREQRLADAEVLEEKLRFISDNVPVRVQNIMGSNAGAGSGEFHMYRQARRREQMRMERIDELDKLQKEQAEKQAHRDELDTLEETKTAKRRAKRQHKKEKAMTRKRGKVSATTGIQEDLSEQQQPPPLTEGLPEVDLD